MKITLPLLAILLSLPAPWLTAQNIGINNSTPTHAKLEINGSVGAAVAMFGADKYGVTIEADNPEIGFNYFFNGGQKTIKAGYAALMGMNPATGELYIGNFNTNQSAANFGPITGYRQNLTLFQNGELRIGGSSNFCHFFYGVNEDTYIRGGSAASKVIINDGGAGVGIGMSNPVRAALEQNGAVGNTAAIFGGEGSGISLQRNWPAIGFNDWFDGTNHKSIGQGYSAQLGVNQNNGALYLASWPFSAVPNATLGAFTQRFYVSRNGRIGLGTDDPQSDIEVVQNGAANGSIFDASNGIRLTNPVTNNFWNIRTSGLFVLNEYFTFLYNGTAKAGINNVDGSYGTLSDAALKRDIANLNSNTLQTIQQLRPVSYFMKDDVAGQQRSYGFLAQDVEKLFPDFVVELGNNKGLTYQYFIPILTKGIQEQQLQIAAVEKENTVLKETVNKLVEQTSQLQREVHELKKVPQ